jgi:hypothetical protein
MATLHDLSVIVAVDPEDVSWIHLGLDLASLPLGAEIFFVGSHLPTEGIQMLSKLSAGRNVRWISEGGGLLAQFGAGAKVSSKKLLWFLAGRVRLTRNALVSLEKSIQIDPLAIHYFNLMTWDGNNQPSVSPRARLNMWVKSALLRLPGGFQGLCVPRGTYFQLGGFHAEAGHPNEPALIKTAKKTGVSIRCTGADLGI